MSETIFYYLVGVTALVALANWRAAIYAVVLLEILRDPVRKIAPGHSVMITVSVGIVWLAAVVVVLLEERRRCQDLRRQHPQLGMAMFLLCLALIPGAMMAIANYPGGWKLVAVGGASYLAPVPGVLVGYAFMRSLVDVRRFMVLYCVANGIAFVGAILEYARVNFPGLGGIEMVWIRHRPGYVVELISGFYRSPDILGLHAAMVIMFAVILSMDRRREKAWIWYLVLIWATIPLLLCGRRKMMAVPVIFAGVFWYLHFRYAWRATYARFAGLVVALALAAGLLFVEGLGTEVGLSGEYGRYAATLLSEGVSRTEEIVSNSLESTWYASGFLGGGLGAATQGSYHVMGKGLTWQEDGAGKLLVELGVPGLVLFGAAVFLVIRRCHLAVTLIPPHHEAFSIQAGLFGVLVANFVCFLAAHQVYSGDPSSVTIVGFCMGIVLAMPARLARGSPARVLTHPRQFETTGGKLARSHA